MTRVFWSMSAWVVGGLVMSGVGVLAYIILGGAYPSGSEWMQNHVEFSLKHDLLLPSSYQIDEVIGGGYYHGLDGRDMWLRFQYVAPSQSELPAWSRSPQCTPVERDIVRRWFLNVAARPTTLSWITPWSELSEGDRLSLKDDTNLDCVFSDQIPLTSTEFPSNCGYWWLHNRQTDFVYVRYACYN